MVAKIVIFKVMITFTRTLYPFLWVRAVQKSWSSNSAQPTFLEYRRSLYRKASGLPIIQLTQSQQMDIYLYSCLLPTKETKEDMASFHLIIQEDISSESSSSLKISEKALQTLSGLRKTGAEAKPYTRDADLYIQLSTYPQKRNKMILIEEMLLSTDSSSHACCRSS